MAHTLYQLEHLDKAAMKRKSEDLRALAFVVRAHQFNESDFKEFIENLNPDNYVPQESTEGFQVFEVL